MALIAILIGLITLISIFYKELGVIMIIFAISIYSILFLKLIGKIKLEKILIIIFGYSIPFCVDINLIYREDYHIVSKEYYKFNIVQIFALIFLFIILKNIKKIKLDIDLSIILLFDVVCIASIFYSINPKAAFYDSIRYIIITIIYIYFSRLFKNELYGKTLINSLVFGLGIQLSLGFLQKLKGGALGLYFLGESRTVFRSNVSGYEMGMSGTFGHPGPYALYSLFILWIGYTK